MVHETVTESDVVDDTIANRADGQANTTRSDSLKQHVFRGTLHSNTVILGPDYTVVDPDIPATNIKPISVEGSQVN